MCVMSAVVVCKEMGGVVSELIIARDSGIQGLNSSSWIFNRIKQRFMKLATVSSSLSMRSFISIEIAF